MHKGKEYNVCSNKIDASSLKTFTSPSPPPCPVQNVFDISSLDFSKTTKESWTAESFTPRYCKFKISAKPELNAKILVTISGKGLYDTRIMTLPSGKFDDGYFKRQIGQPSFSITQYFTEGLNDQEVFWAPSDFDMLVYYSPDRSNGYFQMKISVKKID